MFVTTVVLNHAFVYLTTLVEKLSQTVCKKFYPKGWSWSCTSVILELLALCRLAVLGPIIAPCSYVIYLWLNISNVKITFMLRFIFSKPIANCHLAVAFLSLHYVYYRCNLRLGALLKGTMVIAHRPCMQTPLATNCNLR